MSSDPLFVVGTGRSGTTIVATCLGTHPQLLFIDEPRFLSEILLPAAQGWITVEEFASRLTIYSDGSGKEPIKFFRRLEEHYGHDLGDDGLDKIRQFTLKKCWDFWNRLLTLDLESRFQAIRELVMELMAVTEGALGSPFWLVKQPDLCCCLEELAIIFPQARFLHIMRRPEDVLASRIERKFQANFDQAFSVWQERLDSVVNFTLSHPNRILHIHLEDIVEQPKEKFEQMLVFAGLSMTSEVRVATQMLLPDKAHIGRGRGKFSQAQREKVKDACIRFNKVLGLYMPEFL